MNLLIISPYKTKFTSLLAEECVNRGIDHLELYFDNSDKITILSDNVFINDAAVPQNTIIFHAGFLPDFLALPPDNLIYDYSLFDDTQVAQEQLQSNYMSAMLTLGRINNNILINDPLKQFGLSSILTALAALKSHGFPVVDFISTNSEKLFNESGLADKKDILWSQNLFDSPYKSLSIKRISELFTKKSTLPFMFYKIERGDFVRLWFFRDKCLFSAKIIAPFFEFPEERLEKFEFYLPDESTNRIAADLYDFFEYDFYSMDVLINNENKIIIYRFNPMPLWDYLPGNALEFAVNSLLNKFCDLYGLPRKENGNLPVSAGRSPIFLTRMMEMLFDLNETTK